MALRGLKVIEMAGLAPIPYCGQILKDYGANVIRIDRAGIQDFGIILRSTIIFRIVIQFGPTVSWKTFCCSQYEVSRWTASYSRSISQK